MICTEQRLLILQKKYRQVYQNAVNASTLGKPIKGFPRVFCVVLLTYKVKHLAINFTIA